MVIDYDFIFFRFKNLKKKCIAPFNMNNKIIPDKNMLFLIFSTSKNIKYKIFYLTKSSLKLVCILNCLNHIINYKQFKIVIKPLNLSDKMVIQRLLI